MTDSLTYSSKIAHWRRLKPTISRDQKLREVCDFSLNLVERLSYSLRANRCHPYFIVHIHSSLVHVQRFRGLADLSGAVLLACLTKMESRAMVDTALMAVDYADEDFAIPRVM